VGLLVTAGHCKQVSGTNPGLNQWPSIADDGVTDMPTTPIRFTQESVADLELVKPKETPAQREYRDTESDLWLKVGRKAKTFFVRSNKTGLASIGGTTTDAWAIIRIECRLRR
jgi:hypothetical protein